MKKFALAIVPVALVLALALGACGKPAADGGPGGTTSSGNGGSCATTQTIELGQVDFVQHCVTVSANQTVTFDDPASTGGVHIICTGANATCQAASNAPSELSAPGFTIQPGEQKQVTFTTAGTYKIACTVHPAMNLTVIVK
ncbi:MAG TPA: plastocyanin/azurin family copper-binding protein [Ktedonobacterales bacterium]